MKEKMTKVWEFIKENYKPLGFVLDVIYSAMIMVWYYNFLKKLLSADQDMEVELLTDADDIME